MNGTVARAAGVGALLARAHAHAHAHAHEWIMAVTDVDTGR